MGSMDRNTVIGFVLLAALLFVYLYISTQNSKELQYQQQKEKDSIAFVHAGAVNECKVQIVNVHSEF
ncbi:MAG TPA: hypothetical protein VK616_06980, partial [Flavitalea sp.]|nr:hypothetical protein [Flavitalea sp.]